MDPVQKAIWYVESHSRESLSLEDIARACHVSAYHLTRAFAASTGLSVMRYVRARRLSRAAQALADGADDILALALEAGYGSHEAFTRAFREQFSLTPEAVRSQRHLNNLTLVEAIPMNDTPAVDLTPPRFESQNARTMAGYLQRYNCQSPAGISDQWQRFAPNIGRIPGQVGYLAYGVSTNFDTDGNFDYMSAVEVNGPAELPQGMVTMTIPAHKYAVFTHRGHIAGIRGTYTTIWNKWFPASGHKAANAPTLERYGPEFNPMTGMGSVEIWIPLES